MAIPTAHGRFVLCVSNANYPASLEVRKVYAVVTDANAEATGFIRVIDESGEDYLYPQAHFVVLQLPQEAEDAVLTATRGFD